MKNLKPSVIGGMAAITAVALCIGAASAQEFNLKFSDSLPVNDRNVLMSIKPWMERVTERTGGKVTFTHFPNQQIGRAQDALAMTQSGVVDISYMVPAWISDKLPLVGVAELPGLYTDACVGAKAYWSILQEGGPLYEAEFAAQGIRPLFPMLQSPYGLFTRNKEINSLDDLRGLRIRATGSAQTPFVASIGGVPIGVPGPEVHESMSRGTLDALVFPTSGLFVFDVTAYVKYGYVNEVFGGAAPLVAINTSKWNELPDDVKAVMNEVSEEILIEFCTGLEEWKQEAIAEVQELGIVVGDVPPEVAAALQEKREELLARWAVDFDARGLQGTAMLEAFREGVEAAEAGQ